MAAQTIAPEEKTWHLPPIGSLVTLLSGEAASRALSFVAIAVLTRRLGPLGWAPVAVALTALQFGTLFVESGLRLYGAREVARDRANGVRLVGPIVTAQLLLVLPVLAGALVIWGFGLTAPDLAQLLPGYAVSLLLLPLAVPWLFQGYGEMQWVALPQVVRFAVFLVLSVLLVTSPARMGLLPWLETASMTGAAAVAFIILRRRHGIVPRPAPIRAIDRELVSESTPMAGTQMLWVVRMYLPTLLLWQLASKEDVAQFDVSLRVLMVLQAFLTMYFVNLYTPLSQAAHSAPSRFRSLLVTSTMFAGVLAVVGAVALNAAPGRLLGALFGGSYDTPAAAASLGLLGFVLPVLTIRGHAMFALIALGRQRVEMLCSLVGGILLAVLLLSWVPRAGAGGAALAMLCSETFGLVLTWTALAFLVRRDEPARVARGAAARPRD